ncbi:MAG: carboxypeptidase-like regulatory domain-containing protein [Armatimonadota bacterium]
MRQATGNSFRMVAALAAMAALALAALTTLSGCGGGGGTGGAGLPTGLLVRGIVQDEQGRAVSGIRITVLPNSVSALSGSDGRFTIDVGSGTTPTTFKVDVSNRANEYYEVVGYGGRNVQGCAMNLPAPQGNIIDIGVVTVYSQGSPPPPPHEICP